MSLRTKGMGFGAKEMGLRTKEAGFGAKETGLRAKKMGFNVSLMGSLRHPSGNLPPIRGLYDNVSSMGRKKSVKDTNEP
jgi:hypothetical protein